MNLDHEQPMLDRAVSVVNLADFVRRGQTNLGEPMAGQGAEVQADSNSTDSRYWAWLQASAAVAGWKEKKEGQWVGARIGDLRFVLQERGKTTDERGATFLPVVVPLSAAAAGAAAAVKNATREAKRGRVVEAVFQPLGETPLLLIDDLKPPHLGLFDGWKGVAVFETSPGNLQASLMAPRPLKTWETIAVQRALARRCGLTLAAVSATHFRRFEGSKNHKKALAETFVTRLFCEPIPGTLAAAQLAELLAEDAATAVANTATVIALKTESSAPVYGGKKVPSISGPDHSGSAHDWRWLMQKIDRVGGHDRGHDRVSLAAQLADRAGERQRQGKRADDADHLRYAQLTVDRALAHRAAKKAAGGS